MVFRHKPFGPSITRYLCCLLFVSSMNYYYYLLSYVIFCDFSNIVNQSLPQKSMIIFDDKTVTYLWRIKFIFIYYFVVFYLGHCVLLLPNTLKLFRLPVRRFWVYLMKGYSSNVSCTLNLISTFFIVLFGGEIYILQYVLRWHQYISTTFDIFSFIRLFRREGVHFSSNIQEVTYTIYHIKLYKSTLRLVWIQA